MARPLLTRHEERRDYSVDQRLRMLENDLDDTERSLIEIKTMLRRIFWAIGTGALTLAGNIALRFIEKGSP